MDKTATVDATRQRELARIQSQFHTLDLSDPNTVEVAVLSPLVAEGDVLDITAAPGTGKTFLLTDLAIGWAHPERNGIALGGLFRFSRSYTQSGMIAIIDGENTRQRWTATIRRRLEAEGLDSQLMLGRCIYLTPASVGLHNPKKWTIASVLLVEALAAAKVRFLLVDSLLRLFSPEDPSQSNWVQQGLTPFRDACKRFGITVVVVSHPRRSRGRDDVELTSPMGTSMQEAQVDCQLMMAMDSKGKGFHLRLMKCRRAPWIRPRSQVHVSFAPGYGYVPQDDWESIWPSEPSAEPDSPEGNLGTRRQIIKLLDDAPNRTLPTSALVAVLGVTSRTVTTHLSALESLGRVERIGGGPSTAWRLSQ